MKLVCPICGKRFIYGYKHRKYCSKECRKVVRRSYERERRKRDPDYAEKRESYRRRHIERTRKYAERAVSALDEDSRLLVTLLLCSKGDTYDRRLLQRFYAYHPLWDLLKEIERLEDE